MKKREESQKIKEKGEDKEGRRRGNEIGEGKREK